MVGGGVQAVHRKRNTVGVYPGVEFDALGVGGFDHVGQRVEITDRGFALNTGEPFAPWRKFTGVNGVSGGADLYEDNVHSRLAESVELAFEIGLQSGGAWRGVLRVIDV